MSIKSHWAKFSAPEFKALPKDTLRDVAQSEARTEIKGLFLLSGQSGNAAVAAAQPGARLTGSGAQGFARVSQRICAFFHRGQA